MGWDQVSFLTWLAEYAYDPATVYLTIVSLLLLSSFGLPIPEEFSLLGAGFVVYMGLHPELFPPPTADAVRVKAIPTAILCFFAVFLSDLMVFSIGKKKGKSVLKSKFFRRFLNKEKQMKIKKWTNKYGMWACALFRFTPGIRLPGHLMCGSLNIKTWKFIVADGSAALLTVPTQVIIVAWYGEEIFTYMKKFKEMIAVFIGLGFVFFLSLKWKKWQQAKG